MTMLSQTCHLLRKNMLLFRSFIAREHLLSDFELQQRSEKCLKSEPTLLALYGGRHTVTMLPGIGTGPENSNNVRTVFKEMGAPVDFEVITIDPTKEENDEYLQALVSVKRNGVAIKNNLEWKVDKPLFKERNAMLRNELDLFVYVVSCKSYPGVKAKQKDIDIVIIRQNTHGEYSMLEHSLGGNKVVESLKITRKDTSLRLARYAFEYAKKHGRKKVTTVHKANIMKLTDGLFLEMSRQVAKEYPDIQHNDVIIDNCCMQLVTNPRQFDVLLTPNLYGTIVARVIIGIMSGSGLVSGKNYGTHYAIFEPGTRQKGTSIMGKNISNPLAMMNASVDMLYHLGHREYASKLENAIFKTVVEDKVWTPDLGGTATSTAVVENLLKYVR